MTNPPIPATVWSDAIGVARRRESAARRYAENPTRPNLPGSAVVDDLVRARWRAALDEADAWARYAEYAEACFADAAAHEMAAADELVGVAEGIARKNAAAAHYTALAAEAEQTVRRARYDEHVPGHRMRMQPGPGGLWARSCTLDGCDWRDVWRAS